MAHHAVFTMEVLMHITLTGNLGSGKSTICRILKEKYGFEIYSTGTVQRQLAEEFGLSVLEMNKLMCSDHKYDHLIDDTTARISRENPDKNIVFDSRLAWNFVEKSFKVFLTVSIDEAARRVFADASRGEVETYKSLEDCKNQLKERAANENMRYAELYNVHYFDFDNYNLILDSTNADPELLAETIVRLAKQSYESGEETRQILFSPRRLGETGDGDREYTGESLYPEGVVIIKAEADDYAAVEGLEVLKEAAAGDYPFVDCFLTE